MRNCEKTAGKNISHLTPAEHFLPLGAIGGKNKQLFRKRVVTTGQFEVKYKDLTQLHTKKTINKSKMGTTSFEQQTISGLELSPSLQVQVRNSSFQFNLRIVSFQFNMRILSFQFQN